MSKSICPLDLINCNISIHSKLIFRHFEGDFSNSSVLAVCVGAPELSSGLCPALFVFRTTPYYACNPHVDVERDMTLQLMHLYCSECNIGLHSLRTVCTKRKQILHILKATKKFWKNWGNIRSKLHYTHFVLTKLSKHIAKYLVSLATSSSFQQNNS